MALLLVRTNYTGLIRPLSACGPLTALPETESIISISQQMQGLVMAEALESGLLLQTIQPGHISHNQNQSKMSMVSILVRLSIKMARHIYTTRWEIYLLQS